MELEEVDPRDLATCRELLILAAGMVLAFWVVYRLTDPSYVDPLWGRIAFALVPGGAAMCSYVIPVVRQRMIAVWRVFLCLTVAWFTGLSVLNGFVPSYALGMLFIMAATSTGFSIGLRCREPLLLYLAWSTVLPVLGLVLVDNPGVGPWLLPVSLVSLSIIFYLILDWRIQAEDALRESREQAAAASRLKSTIIGNLNHEFRTPLTSILGFAETLKEELSGAQRERAELIQRSGLRLKRTLDTLIALSRLRADRAPLSPEPINVVEYVRSALEPFIPKAHERGLELHFDTDASSIDAYINPNALERIVTVLTDNAIKFTKEGSVRVRAFARDGTVVIAVTDTGIGIDDEARALLFEPFRQGSEGVNRTEEGLGLGLALVGQLVELMDGEVEVESVAGGGSRFEVRIPRDQRSDDRPVSSSKDVMVGKMMV